MPSHTIKERKKVVKNVTRAIKKAKPVKAKKK